MPGLTVSGPIRPCRNLSLEKADHRRNGGVILAPSAQDDTERIRRWFLQPGSGPNAQIWVAKLEAGVSALGPPPLANKLDPVSGTRLLISQGRKVLYEVGSDMAGVAEAGDVVVLRIFGPGQSDT